MNEPHSLKQSMRASKRYKTPMKEKTKIWFTYPYGEYYESDGTRVLFNREYQLIWKVTPGGNAHPVDEITYRSGEFANTTTFFTEKIGAGWNTPKYRTYVKKLMDELGIDPKKLDAVKLYTQRERGERGNYMMQESAEDDIDLSFPKNSKDFWRWVAGKLVTEGPRGDFIQGTCDLLDCEFMTLERINSKYWSASDEAKKQGNALEREYKKEMTLGR